MHHEKVGKTQFFPGKFLVEIELARSRKIAWVFLLCSRLLENVSTNLRTASALTSRKYCCQKTPRKSKKVRLLNETCYGYATVGPRNLMCVKNISIKIILIRCGIIPRHK